MATNLIRIDTHIDDAFSVNSQRLEEAIREVLKRHTIATAEISLAIIGDTEMHVLNRTHLQHDYPTDVLSFLYGDEDMLQGEVIVSYDTAARESARFGWQVEDELLLYVVHGTLHLVGHDDHAPEDREAMRTLERETLKSFGLTPHYSEPASHEDDSQKGLANP